MSERTFEQQKSVNQTGDRRDFLKGGLIVAGVAIGYGLSRMVASSQFHYTCGGYKSRPDVFAELQAAGVSLSGDFKRDLSVYQELSCRDSRNLNNGQVVNRRTLLGSFLGIK